MDADLVKGIGVSATCPRFSGLQDGSGMSVHSPMLQMFGKLAFHLHIVHISDGSIQQLFKSNRVPEAFRLLHR